MRRVALVIMLVACGSDNAKPEVAAQQHVAKPPVAAVIDAAPTDNEIEARRIYEKLKADERSDAGVTPSTVSGTGVDSTLIIGRRRNDVEKLLGRGVADEGRFRFDRPNEHSVFVTYDGGKAVAVEIALKLLGTPTKKDWDDVSTWFHAPADNKIGGREVAIGSNRNGIGVYEAKFLTRLEAGWDKEEEKANAVAGREAKQEEIQTALNALFKQAGLPTIAAISDEDLIITFADDCDRKVLADLGKALAALDLDPAKVFDTFQCEGTDAMIRYRRK